MRVTVVGGAGFIGGALVKRLHNEGFEVLLPTRGELADTSSRRDWGNVVWAAGLTSDFRRRPLDTVNAHVAHLGRMLHIGNISALVYLSSTRLYQHCKETSEDEAISVKPNCKESLYNLSKLMGENLGIAFGIPRVAVARLSNVVGPQETQRETFLGALCREAHAGEIILQSASHSAKDYIWIDDAVGGLMALITSQFRGTLNIASGRQITHASWVNAISNAVGAKISVHPKAKYSGFPSINVERLNSLIGAERIDPLGRVPEIVVP